jgi:hypothetical protein
MAQIPLPERGQPLDVTYIYELAQAINSISNQVTSATYNYTSIDAGTGAPQNVKTSEARFVGGYKQVTNNTNVNAGEEKSDSYTFSEFKYPPVVTATISNISGTAAGTDATVILLYLNTPPITDPTDTSLLFITPLQLNIVNIQTINRNYKIKNRLIKP